MEYHRRVPALRLKPAKRVRQLQEFRLRVPHSLSSRQRTRLRRLLRDD
jgi:hypothetical protein